jgi:oligoendopeptidase F
MPATLSAQPKTKPVRHFVPADIDLSNVDTLLPVYHKLLARPIESTRDAEQFLLDFSELTSAVDEYGSRRYIDKSCHTDDAEIEARFMHVVEQIEPKIKPLFFELQKKFLASPVVAVMDPRRYGLLIKKWKTDVELFRPENVAIETEIARVTNDYDKISGAMMVSFDGTERTLQQMARFGEQTDRDVNGGCATAARSTPSSTSCWNCGERSPRTRGWKITATWRGGSTSGSITRPTSA